MMDFDQVFTPRLLGFWHYNDFDSTAKMVYRLGVTDDIDEHLYYCLEYRQHQHGDYWQLVYDNRYFLTQVPVYCTVRQFFEIVYMDRNACQHVGFFKHVERHHKLNNLLA